MDESSARVADKPVAAREGTLLLVTAVRLRKGAKGLQLTICASPLAIWRETRRRVATLEAMAQQRRYAVWLHRVELAVFGNIVQALPQKAQIKERTILLFMERYHRYIIRRSSLALLQGMDTFNASARSSSNPACVYDVRTSRENFATAKDVETKLAAIRNGEPLRIVYAGRVSEMKGPIDWLDVIARAIRRGVPLKATRNGDGPLLPAMRAHIRKMGIAEHVTLAGHVRDRPRNLSKMRQAHAFLFCHKTPESPPMPRVVQNFTEPLNGSKPLVCRVSEPENSFQFPWKRSSHGIRHLALMALLVGALTGSAVAQEKSARLFISGHSLTDRPLPDMVAAMAAHDGLRIDWDRQYIAGSTIRQRTFGDDESRPGAGYATGVDRNDDPVDVLAILSSRPQHDIFIVTEWHRVLDALTTHETIRHLRDFQTRAVSANPGAKTYFYAPWADIAELGSPATWVSYERSASPIWRCIAVQAGEGIQPVNFIPASLALADLVAYLNSEKPQGFTAATPGEITAHLFTDHVHLTELGVYFVALITYGTLSGTDLSQAWTPAGPDGSQARTLRAFASAFMERWRAGADGETDCKTLPSGFISTYTGYMQTAYTNAEMGWFRASLKRMRDTVRLSWRFHGWGDNPLRSQ